MSASAFGRDSVTRRHGRRAAVSTGVIIWMCVPAVAGAQGSPASPNQGAIAFTGGLDVPSLYLFRGIRQEGDPKLTLWPSGTLTVALGSNEAARVAVNVGIWNSLHTGTSGTGGPERKLHYEEDFSAGLTLDLTGGVRVRSTFVAYTSPNGSFTTIKEADVEVNHTGRLAPYGLLAFELSDNGQRDEGSKKGTYLELGARPHWSLGVGRATLSVPVEAGLSLRNYYELLGPDLKFHDNRFGFVGVGGLLGVPLTTSASRFGAWQIHGGADVLRFGATTQALNKGHKTAVMLRTGIVVIY